MDEQIREESPEESLQDARWAHEYLDIGLNSVYILARRGELPHYRIGASVRFRKSDLDAWLEARRRGPVLVAVG
jgi:excisionase family DNA binding protein